MKQTVVISFLLMGMLLPALPQDDVMTEGMAAFMRKEYGTAAELFSEAIRQHPADAEAWLWRGKALFFTGEEKAALTVFEKVNTIEPGYASLWIARLYASQDKKEKAFAALEEHLASSLHRPLREIMLDTLLEPLEGDPRWRAVWKREWYSRRERATAAVRGDLLLDDPDAALQEAEAILAQYPDDAVLLALRARAHLGRGELHAAAGDVAKAEKIDGADTTVLMSRALLAEAQKDLRGAAAAYEKLYRQRPGDFFLLLKAARAWREDGETDKALLLTEKYRKYFPGDTKATLQAGELYAGKGDYHSALRLLSQVVEQNPGDPYNFVARGDVYMKAHTYRYAIYDYGMALDLDPSNGDIYYRRGEAYLKTGDTKSACFDFGRALHYGRKKAIIYLQKYCGE